MIICLRTSVRAKAEKIYLQLAGIVNGIFLIPTANDYIKKEFKITNLYLMYSYFMSH